MRLPFRLIPVLVCLFFLSPVHTEATCSVSISFPATTTIVPYGQSVTVRATWSGVRVLISGNHNQGGISGSGVSMSFGSQTGWSGDSLTSNTLNPGTQTLSWFCSDVNGSNHGSHTFQVGPKPETGSVSPKYVILGVIYNPPGPQSFVDYGSSTMLGTSTSLMSSFASSVTESVTVGVSSNDLFGIDPTSLNLPNGGVSTSFSTTDTQEQDTSSSVAITKTSSTDLRVTGPTNGAVGLSHDFDLVKIWLYPVANFKFTDSAHVQLTNYYWDVHDPCDCMDIVLIPVIVLKNPSLITDPNEVRQLARTWAPNLQDGSGPGLTNADLLAIAAADPFSDPNYSPTLAPGAPCTTDGRFCKSINSNVQYAIPAPGEGQITNAYTWNYTTTDTTGQGAKDTHQVGYTIDANFSAGFLGDWSIDIKNSSTFTWVNQWSTLNTKTTGQTSTASITGPKSTDNYTGPTEFLLMQDNVYNSFMFLPVIF